MIFSMLGLLCTPYLIKYHKSCKTVISQGIWVALPIYVLSTFLNDQKSSVLRQDDDAGCNARNILGLYSSLVSILYGFGRGIFLGAFTSLVCLLCPAGQAGKTLGTVVSMFCASGFVMTWDVGNFGIWILVFLSFLWLSLGNLDHEEEEIAVIGDEGTGSVFTVLSDLILYLPLALATVHSFTLATGGFGWLYEEYTQDIVGDHLTYIWMTLLVIAPPLFGIIWDKNSSMADILARVFVIIGGIFILIAVFVPSFTRFWFLGQILVCLGTSPMHAFAYSSAGGYENKIGAMCVYNFWFIFARLFVYFNTWFWGDADASSIHNRQTLWPTFYLWLLFMLISVAVGQKVLGSD